MRPFRSKKHFKGRTTTSSKRSRDTRRRPEATTTLGREPLLELGPILSLSRLAKR